MNTCRNITGQRSGRLIAVRRICCGHSSQWLCRCDCGNESVVRLGNWGVTQSCGCYARDVTIARSLIHGETANKRPSKEFMAWKSMKERCLKKYSHHYANYGGRGIRVCSRWVKSYLAFLKDMGRCPAGRSLHRIRNNGHYQKSNCMWATKRIQDNNKRTNHFIKARGKRMTISNWARLSRINKNTIFSRLANGWLPQMAVTTSVRSVDQSWRETSQMELTA